MPAVDLYNPTGDLYIDGLLDGVKWATTSLSFSFPTDPSFYGSAPEAQNNFEAFTATQQNAVRKVLEHISSVCGLSFNEVTETSSVHGALRYAETDAESTAHAITPHRSEAGGDSWYNNSSNDFENPVKGTWAYHTFLHETGHALGLKHPHSQAGIFQPMPIDGDSGEYSVMSYRSYIGAPFNGGGFTNGSSSFPQTLMMFDIAALQELYGANYTTNSGNTLYSWSPVTGEMFANGIGQQAPAGNKIFMTIWDGGGQDTYDFSNYANAVSVKLQPGDWSICSEIQRADLGNGHRAAGNIANALLYDNNPASLIENAICGVGTDSITGNIADNRFTGAGGNDTLTGAAGTDTAIYSGLFANYRLDQNTNGSWSIADLRSGSPDGTDTLWTMEFCEFDDITYLLTAPPPSNQPPVVAIADQRVGVNQWSQIQGWISYSDADGNAATQYQFWDQGIAANSGYFSTPGNPHHPSETVITVNAADLANVSVRGGQVAGSETLWVRAFDGTAWSAWDPFNFTTVGNSPPVATISDHSLGINGSAQVQAWISYSDADGNAATQYQFWDQGIAANSGYFSTPGNAHHPSETVITVSAADLANVSVRGGQVAGTENLWVRAFDGTDWSQWDSFNFTTVGNSPPVVTVSDHSLAANQWSQIQGWISYSDADGNAATQYQFWDQGIAANSGYFWTPSNAHHPSETVITVNAADLANVWVRGGQVTGSESLWVRAFDGSAWSAWDSWTMSTFV